MKKSYIKPNVYSMAVPLGIVPLLAVGAAIAGGAAALAGGAAAASAVAAAGAAGVALGTAVTKAMEDGRHFMGFGVLPALEPVQV